MNLLEHYVTNITHEEPIEKNGMLFFKVVCDVDCYGNKKGSDRSFAFRR